MTFSLTGMIKIVQCVPNFSEGRRLDVVEALANAVRNTPGAVLADYSADADHNRCVLTFLGAPDAVRKALFEAACVAVELIDVSGHTGQHPRIGAIDVVPFVPVLGCTMDECVELSCLAAKDLAKNLYIPIYLYACSANHSERRSLPKVRRGGLGSLRRTGLLGERRPDLGPWELHPTAGAAIVGARGPLIAFNVNLATADPMPAATIAASVRRERSHVSCLAGVRAIGVALESSGLTQVSTNITRPGPSSLLDVYSYVAGEAASLGVKIAGAELIGTIRAEHLDKKLFDLVPNLALSPLQILDPWVEKCLSDALRSES